LHYLLSVNNIKRIDRSVLALFSKGCFNLHPGKLPEYAGLHVAQWAIRNGEAHSYATLHYMNAHIDEGAIAYEHRLPVDDKDTGLSLMQKCMSRGVGLVVQLFKDIINGVPTPKTPQDMENFRCYRTSDAKDGRVYFDRMTAADVYNFVRAADYGAITCPTYNPYMITEDGSTLHLKPSNVVVLGDTVLQTNFCENSTVIAPGEVIGRGTSGDMLVVCKGKTLVWIVMTK